MILHKLNAKNTIGNMNIASPNNDILFSDIAQYATTMLNANKEQINTHISIYVKAKRIFFFLSV